MIIENEKLMKNREEIIQKFFGTLVVKRKPQVIRVGLVRVLLPNQHFFSNEYLKETKKMIVPWVAKSIKNYHTLVGGVDIDGTLIPKCYIKGETPQIRRIRNYSTKGMVTAEIIKNTFDSLGM